jgi:hypothetical protein
MADNSTGDSRTKEVTVGDNLSGMVKAIKELAKAVSGAPVDARVPGQIAYVAAIAGLVVLLFVLGWAAIGAPSGGLLIGFSAMGFALLVGGSGGALGVARGIRKWKVPGHLELTFPFTAQGSDDPQRAELLSAIVTQAAAPSAPWMAVWTAVPGSSGEERYVYPSQQGIDANGNLSGLGDVCLGITAEGVGRDFWLEIYGLDKKACGPLRDYWETTKDGTECAGISESAWDKVWGGAGPIPAARLHLKRTA